MSTTNHQEFGSVAVRERVKFTGENTFGRASGSLFPQVQASIRESCPQLAVSEHLWKLRAEKCARKNRKTMAGVAPDLYGEFRTVDAARTLVDLM